MKHPLLFSLSLVLFIILLDSNVAAQCPNQLTNQSTSITLSAGYTRSGTQATSVQIGASCGLQIVGDLGATYARYEIPINVADNALIAGDQIEISMDITNVTANFQYDVKSGSNVVDTSTEPVSGRIITVPSGATTLLIRLFTNLNQNDVSGSFDISNLSVSKVGLESNDTQPPNTPTNIAVSNITSDSAFISWNASNDNGGGNVNGYEIYNNGIELANVAGTSTTLMGLDEQTNYNISVAAYDNASPANISTASSPTIQFTTSDSGSSSNSGNSVWTASGANLYFDEGNVGIGVTNPISKLQVKGRTATGSTGSILYLDWTNETNWGGSSNKWSGYIGFNAYRNSGDTKDTYYGNNRYTNKAILEGSNYGFRWLYRNRIVNDSNGQHLLNEYMRLTNNGNLGIGTTNPGSYKLAVKGKIRAEEIKVETGWADYVFKEDYDLPTLEEVENHIKEKGHLINIPSANEVEENGVQLGQMNKLLLEKIEELTLYTLEQEKRIKNLERLIKEMKK